MLRDRSYWKFTATGLGVTNENSEEFSSDFGFVWDGQAPKSFLSYICDMCKNHL